jgi:membrane protein implicated in regulation of membrane protease activity
MDTNGARASTAPGEQEPSPQEALRRLLRQIEELRAYATHFVSAKVDAVMLSARQLLVWAVLGIVGLMALAGLVVTSVVLFLSGAAGGLGRLFGGRLWLGQLVVGVGFLVLLTLSILIGVRTWQRRSRQQKVQQYDERQLQQRAAFGHSVADRATEDGSVQHYG